MEESALVSILQAILVTHDGHKDRSRCASLIDHVQQVFGLRTGRLRELLQESQKVFEYVLEVVAHLPATENLVLYVYNENTCRLFTINGEEKYQLPLGDTIELRVKFNVARLNGEAKKAIVRSSSLLKRLTMGQKEDDSILLSLLSLGSLEKRCIAIKGRSYNVELTVTKTLKNEVLQRPSFSNLLDFTRILHEYDAMQRTHCIYSGELGDFSFATLHYAIAYCFQVPPTVLKILELCIFMVWDSSERQLDERTIAGIVSQLRTQQMVDTSNITLLKEALTHLYECVCVEIEEALRPFHGVQFFPPTGHHTLKQINLMIKSVVDICVLSVWDQGTDDPSLFLESLLSQMLHDSAAEWSQSLLDTEQHLGLKECCLSIQRMWELLEKHSSTSSLFFHQFSIDYVAIVLTTIDDMLRRFSREYLSSRLSSLDSRDPSELELFSKCTMKLYKTLSSISDFGIEHRVKNLVLYQYESWFNDVTVYWTYSWRNISRDMVSRTLPLQPREDEDSFEVSRRPLPQGLYSFLCIQKGLSDDYSMLSFDSAENIMMASVALIHIFGENTCMYAKKLYHEARAASDPLCGVRAVNGMEQALDYLDERWTSFLKWHNEGEKLEKSEKDALLKTMEAVLRSTRKRCEELIKHLIRRFTKTKLDEVTKIVRILTLDHTEYSSTFKAYRREVSAYERVHATLEAVEKVADDLRAMLLPECAQFGIESLFDLIEAETRRLAKQVQSSAYYTQLYVTLKSVMEMLDVKKEKSTLTTELHYRSFSTEDLILSYYNCQTEMTETTKDKNPQLQLRIGYSHTSSDNVLLFVYVRNLENLPALNTLCDRLDLYVRAELLPKVLYPESCFPHQKTKTMPQRWKPQWSHTFRFMIPQEFFFTNGSTVCLSVLDHDRLGDRLLGRCFIATSKIETSSEISMRGPSESRGLPLLQPTVGNSNIYFQMIRERSWRDEVAGQFMRRETTARQMHDFARQLLHRASIVGKEKICRRRIPKLNPPCSSDEENEQVLPVHIRAHSS